MKNIKVTYKITLDGKVSEYTETREAHSIRQAHAQIISNWYGVDEIEFISDIEA